VSAASAADAVLAAAAAAGGGCVIVDLSAVEFIDCCALGALARVQKLAWRAVGGALLAAPREPVRRLLDLTGLSGVFSIHASTAAAAACRALRSGSPRPAPHRPEGSLAKRQRRALPRDGRIPAAAGHQARG
jgi:anti-anti-sigma factor